MHSHIWKIAGAVLWKKKWKSLFMVLTILGSIIGALIPPLILGTMVDTLSDKRAILLSVPFLYLFTLMITGLLESLQNIMITMMGQAITHEMRSVMGKKLQALPTGYFTQNETGKITSRFVNDVDAVDSLFTNGIISMLADAFKIISIIVIIFIKSIGLGVMMLLITPLLFFMTMLFQRKMRAAQLRNRNAVAMVNHHVPETIKNIRMVHTFSCEQFMEKQYDTYIEEGYHAINQSNFYDSIYSPIIVFVSSMVIAVMMVCAASGSVMQQFFGISIGSAVAMIAYVGKVFDPLESLGMEIQNIQTALAGVERIDEFLNVPERTVTAQAEKSENESHKSKSNKSETALSPSEELVRFDQVTFDYGDGKAVLSDLSFQIKQGENVIFTGRTGAGKSTIFRLLLGMYPPNTGQVTIHGQESYRIYPEARRRLFGYVEQHFAVVDGTLRDQVTLFDPDISDEEVWISLEECGLGDKIKAMTDGLDTRMNLSEFSQGELQLLSIARALVAKPEIMLLDEMTANLDSITEHKILDIIHQASVGRTVISISHRLAEKLEESRIIQIV